jgi:Iron-dependent Transcriptional regulator/Helix-turn-helix domain/Homeodomain-like domain
MVQGRRPDNARRQLVVQLRSRGWTLTEIGRWLGVSRQAVSALIRSAALPAASGTPCSACAALIPTRAARPQDRPGALCLRCLEQFPDAPLGQRLRALRLAAGLSRTDVAWLAGVLEVNAQRAELGRRPKNADAPGRVARVLGLPEAPAVFALRLPPIVLHSLRGLLGVARAGFRGQGGRALAKQCGVGRRRAIAQLRKGGLIAAVGRGLSGYRLARPAKDIRLLDVAEAVGSSVQLELPVVPVKGGDELHRRLQVACDDAAEAAQAVLWAVSLEDLLSGEGG